MIPIFKFMKVLVIDFLTLVSNFGGSLGLFVGFSFFMVWDLVKDAILLGAKPMKMLFNRK